MESAQPFTQYFEKLVTMIEGLSDSFSRYQEYETILIGSQRFQSALAAVYYDILVFLKKAKSVFTTKGCPESLPCHSIPMDWD